MNCGRVSNQLSAYIDRELTGVEMLHIRRHLDDCAACCAEYDALCRMKMALGRLRSPEPGSEFVRQTVRRWERHQASEGGWQPAYHPWLLSLQSRFPASSPDRLVSLLSRLDGTWRLSFGLATLSLAAALMLTGVFLHRPRHADALIATSPIAVLEGQDPLSRPARPDWASFEPPHDPLFVPRGFDSPLPVNWVTVSFPSDAFRSYR